MEIELAYIPITDIDEKNYDRYLFQLGLEKIVKKIAIEPLEEAMKSGEGEEEFDFTGFKVSSKQQTRASTSWEKVYSSLLEFLAIRADDSRAAKMEDVKLFEGIGYCILIPALKSFVERQIENKTDKSTFKMLYWPRMKKGEEYPREILLPDRDFLVVNEENARIVLQAKRFCSGLEKEVVDAFKDLNKEWFGDETNYSKENLPSKEQSPLKRTRRLAKGKYIFVALVREEEPRYKEIIDTLMTELNDLDNGVALPGYKIKSAKDVVFVNIKNVFDRLSLERLQQDNLIKVEGRYEIVP